MKSYCIWSIINTPFITVFSLAQESINIFCEQSDILGFECHIYLYQIFSSVCVVWGFFVLFFLVFLVYLLL